MLCGRRARSCERPRYVSEMFTRTDSSKSIKRVLNLACIRKSHRPYLIRFISFFFPISWYLTFVKIILRKVQPNRETNYVSNYFIYSDSNWNVKRAFQILLWWNKVFIVIISTLEGIVIVIPRNQTSINMLMENVSRTHKWSIITFPNCWKCSNG